MFVGIYLDDLAIMHICPPSKIEECCGPDFEEMKKCQTGCHRVGLELASDKGFGFGGQDFLSQPPDAVPKKADTDFVTWGTEVWGKLGECGTQR